jgi:hypothetical protein
MTYPFQPNLRIPHRVAVKLKIMSVAENVPITQIVTRIVDIMYDVSHNKETETAKKKLGIKNKNF